MPQKNDYSGIWILCLRTLQKELELQIFDIIV